MSACRRTVKILDRWLDAGQLDARDARHLARCPRCTEAFAHVDAAEQAIRAAVRSLVLEASAAGVGPLAPQRMPADRIGVGGRAATSMGRFAAGLASLVAVVVLVVVAGIRMSTTPAAPSDTLLPVLAYPAEQALHRSGLRCTEIATGLECARRLPEGWRQVAQLDVVSGYVRRLVIRLVPGTASEPVDDLVGVLSEPVSDVLQVDLTEAIDDAVDGSGVACGCTRPVAGGAIHLEGDPVGGYRLTIDGPR